MEEEGEHKEGSGAAGAQRTPADVFGRAYTPGRDREEGQGEEGEEDEETTGAAGATPATV